MKLSDVTNINIANVNKDKYAINLGLWGSWDIYPIEYIWTKDETDVTTTNITADKGSIFIDQLTSNEPELIHFAITILSSYSLRITSYKTTQDKIAEIVTKKLVIISEFLSPINFPNPPDIIEANKGNAIIKTSMLTF